MPNSANSMGGIGGAGTVHGFSCPGVVVLVPGVVPGGACVSSRGGGEGDAKSHGFRLEPL